MCAFVIPVDIVNYLLKKLDWFMFLPTRPKYEVRQLHNLQNKPKRRLLLGIVVKIT